MKKIKVKFCDFESHIIKNNVFLDILYKYFDVEISDNPDILFYSVFNNEHYNYKCLKVFVSAEPFSPNFNECDYAITSCEMTFGNRHCYYPYYFMLSYNKYVKNENFYENLEQRTKKFCNFIYSHSASQAALMRDEFCIDLMKYKNVDCLGKTMNNCYDELLGDRTCIDWHEKKLNVLNKYKFTIAFENTNLFGYSTEKIIDPLLSKSIPIYYGNEGINKLVNSEAYINVNEYIGKIDELIKLIESIDNSETLYYEYINVSKFLDENIEKLQIDLETFICEIIDNGKIYDKDPYDFGNKTKISSISTKTFAMYKILYFINSKKKLREVCLKLKELKRKYFD